MRSDLAVKLRGASFGDRRGGARRRPRQPRRPPRAARPLPAADEARLPRTRQPSAGSSSTTTSSCAAASSWRRPGSRGSPSTWRPTRDRLPPPALAVHDRLADDAQPRRDGLDAHRPGGQRPAPPRAGGILRRAGPRRSRPDHHRRLLPQPARLAQAVRLRDVHPAAGDAAPRGHRRRARRRWRDRDAGAARGPLRLSPVQRQRLEQEEPDHAVPAQPAVHEGRRPHRHRLRRVGRAGGQGGLRRGRDHGFRGLPDQPVPGRSHQRPHRRVGRHCGEADAVPARDRAPLARAGRRRLPDHLPDLAARPGRGRPDLGGGRRPRPRTGGGRGDRPQHRHRLARGAGADDHHPGAARRLAVRDGATQGRGVGAGLRVQPDQQPRDGRGDPGLRRGRPGLDGAAAAGRPRVRRQGAGRSRRRDQHLHRLQPGLPRPCLQEPEGVLPGQPARLPRDHAGARPDQAQGDRRRGRRRPGRASGRGLGRRARLRGHALREGTRDRRPVPAGDGRARQGGLRRDPALLRPPARGARRRRAAGPRGHRRRPGGVRRGDRGHRRRRRGSPSSAASTTRRS